MERVSPGPTGSSRIQLDHGPVGQLKRTAHSDRPGLLLGAILVGGFTLVVGGVFQGHGGKAEAEQGGGVSPQKFLPFSPQNQAGRRSSFRAAGEIHLLALHHLLTWIH